MSITVNLYTFAKKVNSTGRPSTSPLALDCVLKDSCSIIYPVIGVDRGITWNPSSYNYAQISAFNRYYYVNDWSFAEGLWWAALSVDALASWRSEIYGTTEYVGRAASTYDGAIIDILFPAKSTYALNVVRWNGAGLGPYTPWTNNIDSGFYVVGIINNDSNSLGAVSYYAFTPSQFANLKSYLLGDVTWTGILATNPDIGENLFKALFNPFQYITTIYWYPFSVPSGIGDSISSIKFGWWEIQNISGYRLTNYYHLIASTLQVLNHPEARNRGVFLNGGPYSKYILYAPPFGEFELDAGAFPNAAYTNNYTPVSCSIVVDLISGQGKLTVTVDGRPQLVNQTQIAISIQIAQLSSEKSAEWTGRVAEQGLSTLISNTLGSSQGERIVNMGVQDAISIGDVRMMQTGSNGTLCQFMSPFFIACIYYDMTDDANTDKGRPLCKEVLLSTLAPGYVITAGSHVAIAGTETEISAVNGALDGGVFLE